MGLEQKVVEMLLDSNHVSLLVGVFSVLFLLKSMEPIKATLFTEKWKWLIAPLNLSMSSFGIFALGLTSAQTLGLKIVIALLVSAVVTLTYEAVAKPLTKQIEKRLSSK